MRVAFTSCMSSRVVPDQPVWDWIRHRAPDVLVLLGDSIYADLRTPQHPKDMDEMGFATHMHRLYNELFDQAQFARLVRTMPAHSVHAIWDDHDFLWDDALGAEMDPVYSGNVRVSTALFEAFRATLAARLDRTQFPASAGDPRLWNPAQKQLSTPSVRLQNDLWLHLSDGRTHRTRRIFIAPDRITVFGAAQRAQLETAILQAPNALHLFASGSTVGGIQRYQTDLRWLLGTAAQQRMLVLSGDVHFNNLDAFYTGGWPLHEATSSGAGIRAGVDIGQPLNHFGLLEVAASRVTIELFKDNQVELRRVLDRSSWLPV